jgi:hypothetical protein
VASTMPVTLSKLLAAACVAQRLAVVALLDDDLLRSRNGLRRLHQDLRRRAPGIS